MSTEVRLSREMRLIDVTMIGVGAMIGAGIFVLTGIAAGVAGPSLLVVFLLNGLVAFLTAAAYAELGGAVHGAGGGYLWIKASMPDPGGFLAGWMDWFAHAVACSLYALGFGAYFVEVLTFAGAGEISTPWLGPEIWFAVLACVFFTIINYRGASEAGKAGNVVTIGKVAIIGVFIAGGLFAMTQRPDWQASFTPFFTNGWAGVFGAMGLTFIAFEGYEIIAQTSEEVEDPKTNVPKAVFLSLVIVIPVYLLVALVSVGAVTPPPGVPITEYLGQSGETALVTAADQFFVGGAIVLLVGGLLSTLSALNATIYSSSRVAFAMARDASLPKVMARVHAERGTPHYSIVTSSIIIVGMAILLPIEEVAAAASVMFLLLFGGVNVALIRLRKLRPDLDRGYKVPLMPFTPILAIVAMLFIAGFMFVDYPVAWLAAGGWIVLGVVFYYAYSRTREAAFLERVRWMERLEKREYRVLVAVSSPATVRSLVEVAVAIAKSHEGELLVMSVVEVPEGDSLLTGRKRVREMEPVLNEAVRYAEESGVTAKSVIKIGRRISQGIVQTAREEGCNFLIIGQPSGTSLLERIVASIGERVLQQAPCHVGVVYGDVRSGAVDQVLVPITQGRNSELAAQLVPAFTEFFDAPARPVTMVDWDFTDVDAAKAEEVASRTAQAAGLDQKPELLRASEAARGLLDLVRGSSLVLVGAPSAGPIAPILGETVPGALAANGRAPTVVVRGVEPHRVGRFERVFFRQGQ